MGSKLEGIDMDMKPIVINEQRCMREYILLIVKDALEKNENKPRRAAKALCLSVPTVYRYIREIKGLGL